MDIGNVLSRAWNIIWKHKVLWIFGILASCGQGGGGNGGGGGNSGYQFSQGDPNVSPEAERFFFGIEQFFQQIEAWQIVGFVALLILFFLVLWFIMLALSTIGRVGLIQGALQADADAEAEKLSFMELFEAGKPFFWRIIGLNLLIGLAAFVVALLIFVPIAIIGAVTVGIGFICALPLICILVPLMWLVSVVIEQANIAIIIEDTDVISGIRLGWEVFRNNLGNMIVMALILGIGGAIIGFIFALPIFFLVIPAAFGGILSGATESALPLGGGIAAAALCFVGYLPILIVLGGVLRAYVQTAWTLTYMQLTTGNPEIEENLDTILEE
ncbi:MAG: hypothetical protein ISR58_03625 [Anaerolineales bacterium]|nr:hypothetical protein [Chloroflexota bacterium]MBL6980262.1 hypothetical protein [Anaerolineales bacterium]